MAERLDLAEIEQFISGLLLEKVGPVLALKAGGELHYDLKTGNRKVDIVTEVDRNVETLIRNSLKERYPGYGFVGEESYVAGQKLPDGPTFVVDPIDGTTNFVHGFPYSCTSVGMCIDGEPVIGVVHNPHLNLMVSASKGTGVRVNGERMRPHSQPGPLSLNKSVVAMQPGSAREGPNFDAKMRTYERLLACDGGFIHGTRNLGSTAMSLVYIALGYLDSYWDGGCYSWDVCAGWCILHEAGGVIVGANRDEWHIGIDNRSYLAVRAAEDDVQQNEYIKEFWKNVQGTLNYD